MQTQLIPLNRLLFINAEQILLKDIFGQGRAHLRHTLFSEEPFLLYGRVRQQMDVGMMALIVKGGIPFQMIHGDLQAIGQSLCLCPEHIPPPDAGIETEALRIFSAQRNNKCPHISLMSIQLLGYLFQLYLDTIIREQPMVAEPFRTGPGADVVGIGFLVQDLMGIVLNGTGDKF